MSFTYSVSIRTVGKAGEKYKQELESIFAQSIKPAHVYIHLAHGFERPNIQVGYEEYIDTPKGLVHQRSCSCDGVKEDFLLILDDDIYLPKDAVETMYNKIIETNSDGIAPDTFSSQNMSSIQKILTYATSTVYGRCNDGWAIKIQKSGAFSFNNNPLKYSYLPTESFPGTALFVKTVVFKNIHYEDEHWIDSFPAGTFAEDQVMSYKFHVNGHKILMSYDSGILHLDANTNKASQKSYDKLYNRAMSIYLTWHRTIYSVSQSPAARVSRSCAFWYRFTIMSLTRTIYSVMQLSPRFIIAFIKGVFDAKKYAKTEEYKNLRPFKLTN